MAYEGAPEKDITLKQTVVNGGQSAANVVIGSDLSMRHSSLL